MKGLSRVSGGGKVLYTLCHTIPRQWVLVVDGRVNLLFCLPCLVGCSSTANERRPLSEDDHECRPAARARDEREFVVRVGRWRWTVVC
jgi:hypothetical protein